MIIPSVRLRHLITQVSGGVWLEEVVAPATESAVALIGKLPTPILKATYLGCTVRLILGRVIYAGSPILCLVLAFDDTPADPYYVFRVVTTPSDLAGLRRLLESNRLFWLHCFDETARPAISLKCLLPRNDSHIALSAVLNRTPLPLLDDDIDIGSVLDVFHDAITGRQIANDPSPGRDLSVLTLKVEERTVPKVYTREVFGGDGTGTRLDNQDEGGGLEQQVFRLVDEIFGGNAIRSPVLLDKQARELTDVLAIDADLVLCFECKVEAVLARLEPFGTSKRGRLLRKHIGKALRQLQGAFRRIRRGARLVSDTGESLEIPAGVRVAGVCVVSQMEPECDWTAVFRDVVDATRAAAATFQVLDLGDLGAIAAACATPGDFRACLQRRWEAMIIAHTMDVEPKSYLQLGHAPQGR